MIIGLFAIILLNIILILFNIPLDKNSVSILGLFSFFGGSLFFIPISLIVLVKNILEKRNKFISLVSLVSFLLFCLSFYWDVLTFRAIDSSSLSQVSIWYRLGPSLCFTFGILISINFWFWHKFLRKN